MRREEALVLLRAGDFCEWNRRRRSGARVPDLAGANLAGAKLSSTTSWSGEGANLDGVDLSGADLRGTALFGVSFVGANLTDAVLEGAVFAEIVDLSAVTHVVEVNAVDFRRATLHRARLANADLSGLNLSGADLRDSDLQRANLSRSELDGTDLRGARLRHANLRDVRITDSTRLDRSAGLVIAMMAVPSTVRELVEVDLSGADLSDADLSAAVLRGTSFRGARLRKTKFQRADLRRCDFRKADLEDADLRGADLRGADLRDADLTRTVLDEVLTDSGTRWDERARLAADILRDGASRRDLRQSDLHGACLRGANLQGASLIGADLRDSVLVGADLRGADLVEADLSGCNLTEAHLSGANLSRADLSGAKLNRTVLTNAILDGAVFRVFSADEANLSGARLAGMTLTPEDESHSLGPSFLDLASVHGLEHVQVESVDFVREYADRVLSHLARDRAKEEEEDMQIVFGESLRRIRTLRRLYASKRDEPESLVGAVRTLTSELITYLASHPRELFALRPRQFEQLVAEVLASFGWEVQLTPVTRDGGYDIFAVAPTGVPGIGANWIIECKKYASDNRVGVGVVRSLYGVKSNLRVGNAMVATTSSFTKGAEKFRASRYDLDLRGYEDLRQWLEQYEQDAGSTLYRKRRNREPSN